MARRPQPSPRQNYGLDSEERIPEQIPTESDSRLAAWIGVNDRFPVTLVLAGFTVVVLGAFYFGLTGTVRYAPELLSFGVLAFMVGVTYVSLERKVQWSFIAYMWAAAFIIIGSLTGVSLYTLLGTFVKP